ncbi:MAG: hypothetical protein B7C24_18320 [Bacteroidetes bacterium 4572_77]|nr:MAG: hypothetical protein B7C24_18320 [Bacteroidetes bacterium 4572_77]
MAQLRYLIDTKKHNDFLKAKHFDYVLIDAPCSGFGTIRRNPDKKYSLSIDIIKEFQKQQKEILKYYSQFLKNGGHLIYATCSILQLENEDILEDFLSKNPDFKPNPFKSSFDKYKLQIPIKEDTYHLTIFPEDFETDGFFIASLVRRSD